MALRVDAATRRLRALLRAARNPDGGWPYYAGRRSRLEPTCWALLALPDEAADATMRWQTADGLLTEPGFGPPNLAFNALAALSLSGRGAGTRNVAAAIIRALLGRSGLRLPNSDTVRLNASLQGWPWTDGTFSWVEPTAWCTLAVKRLAGGVPGARSRIEEAERLLRDRVCISGGWNYGNPQVYGTALHAHVPPTAVGVLALQDALDDPVVGAAIAFLQRQAAIEGSTTALALGWIALTAAGARADDLSTRLLERIVFAEEFGNLSSTALMLYVLDAQERGALPAALVVRPEERS